MNDQRERLMANHNKDDPIFDQFPQAHDMEI